VPFGLILILLLILFLFLTAENTELAESFSLSNIIKNKENLLPKVGNKFGEKLKMLPSGFSMIGQCCH
jgi:hypothetical protein